MPAPPLTHHDILALVEPFSRQGRAVDLAATDRVARRIAFKPVEHAPAADAPADAPGLRETLALESLGTGTFRLTRTLTRPDGVQATLQALGSDAADLLARVAAVPPQQHFQAGPGYVIARSYGFQVSGGSALAHSPPTRDLVLSRGEVHVHGLVLGLNVSAVKSVAGELHLGAAAGAPFDLPEDLLAVIGWDWARLVHDSNGGWSSKLRLRGLGERRTRAAEAALQAAAVHLARVLAEPPARFHARHRGARWGVVLRRGIPTLTALALVAGTILLPRIAPQVDSGVWLALHYAPIGILAVAFSLQELPRFEIPPLPRPLRAEGWRGRGG